MSTSDLIPANQNPWYILMTLHGEQEGNGIDFDLAAKNRRAWNGWACRGMTQEAIEQLIKDKKIAPEETQLSDEALAEIKQRFVEVWKKRNSGMDVPEFPHPGKNIDLSKITFSNPVVLEKVIFGSNANFSYASFTQAADFSRATFTKYAIFSGATFTQDADFPGATFTQEAYFLGATVTQDAYFFRATFTQDANFSGVTFTKGAHFSNAIFEGVAGFGHVTFDAEPSETPALDFSGVQMNGPVNFERAKFKHHYPKLTNATLHKSVQVTADEDHWPRLPKALNIFTGMSQRPSIRNQKEAKESAAKLRHAMALQALPEEEHFFFRREMYHAGRFGPWLNRLPIKFYGAVSDYGASVARPTILLALVFVLGAVIYALRTPQGIGESIGYSFATMFKFFGLQRTYFDLDMISTWPGWVQWFSASQTVVSYILLFFLGLGLRTRFRLR